MIKKRYLALSPFLLSIGHAYAVDQATKDWAENINTGFAETFKASDPVATVPNFTTGPTGNEDYASNPNLMSSDSVTQAATDPGAQLIDGIPSKPKVSDEDWFKNATDITKDPTKEIDDLTGDYTDCEEVTKPGDTYTEKKSCTETLLPETANCSVGKKMDIDVHHLYACYKERQTTDGKCTVGRDIDVTQAHNYKCQEGRNTRTKTCNESLNITVEKTYFKYLPQAMCSYNAAHYNMYGLSHDYLVVAKSTHLNYQKQRVAWNWVNEYVKNAHNCNVYQLGSGYGTNTGWRHVISGSEYHGCRPGDNLWDDGYCHSKKPIAYQSALPSCPWGRSMQGSVCVSQPAWIHGYIADTNNFGVARQTLYSSWGKEKMVWALHNGHGAYYYWEGRNVNEGEIKIGHLRGHAPGYPASAQMKAGRQVTQWSGVGTGEIYILLANPDVTVPTFTCNTNTSPVPGLNMCQSNTGHLEYRIIDNWVKSCD